MQAKKWKRWLPYYAAKRIQRYWRRYLERKHANDEPKKGVRHPKFFF